MKSIEWSNGKVRFIDQTKLPLEEVYVETDSVEVLADAIRSLKIRGAPALGIAAAYAIVLGSRATSVSVTEELLPSLERAAERIAATRPTAKNLFWALERMKSVFRLNSGRDVESLRRMLLEEARRIHKEDEEMCRAIGQFGSELVPTNAVILTHCSTGALATGGIGTAQGVITTAYEQGKSISVYVDETRPLLQGARLTAWELKKKGINVTLITDNAAAFTLKTKKVNMVIVGADRIAANGDTANKIGTYGLAVLAREHKIPFYVAAPTSTTDPLTRTGDEIPIEERSAFEVTDGFGRTIAPVGVSVYSPAFDITPHVLISAFITEKGIIRPPYSATLAALVGSLR